MDRRSQRSVDGSSPTSYRVWPYEGKSLFEHLVPGRGANCHPYKDQIPNGDLALEPLGISRSKLTHFYLRVPLVPRTEYALLRLQILNVSVAHFRCRVDRRDHKSAPFDGKQ